MSENTEAVAGSFDSYKWPLIVFVLLLGHTSLMLLVMTLANADPPELVEGSPFGCPVRSMTSSHTSTH